jgi:hypothetical protein
VSGLAERIARCLPGGSFELETLVRLVGIDETDAVPTAAVTCRSRARLLINPQFAAEYCQRDEHLFLLVMHEMWHVLLGHTTLYGRPTPIHNIAFDALINAGLARQHPEREYRGFFERLNRADVFPELLLRPPVGWPLKPQYDVGGPPGTEGMLRRLYPPLRQSAPEPLYDEIVELVRQGTDGINAGVPVLLGDHSGDPDDAMDDPLFGDVVRRIVGSWPPPPVPMGGRDAGRDAFDRWVQPVSTVPDVRRAFAAIIRQAVMPDRRGAERTAMTHRVETVGPGPLPNPGDRMHPARRLLIGDHALANQRIAVARRQPDPPVQALVYLDVSGSMGSIIAHLLDLLAPPARQRLVTVRQFSTEVAPLTIADLVSGRLTTTDGTHIDCVLEDLGQRHERRVVIVTDGYVGTPSPALLAPLLERRVQFHTVLPDGGWCRDLEPHSTIHHLPLLET